VSSNSSSNEIAAVYGASFYDDGPLTAGVGAHARIRRMKGASKPKKVAKKPAQKTLKERRSEKRLAAKKQLGSS
jgi:hypothetical protein